jgi:hypothetical protein
MMEIAKLYIPQLSAEKWAMALTFIVGKKKNNNCNKLRMKVQRTVKLLCDVACNVKASDM